MCRPVRLVGRRRHLGACASQRRVLVLPSPNTPPQARLGPDPASRPAPVPSGAGADQVENTEIVVRSLARAPDRRFRLLCWPFAGGSLAHSVDRSERVAERIAEWEAEWSTERRVDCPFGSSRYG